MATEDNRLLLVLARRGGRTREQERMDAEKGVGQTRRLAPAAAAPSRAPSADGTAGNRPASGSRAGRATPREASKGSSRAPTMAPTASARPTQRTGRPQSAMAQRPVIGRNKDEGKDVLADFKDKVNNMVQMDMNLDFSEKPFFRPAIWEATWRNHEDIVRYLVEKRASVAVADYQGRTPLHEASYYGHQRLVEFLLEKGHPVDCADNFGQTPLFRAVEGRRHDVVELLVRRRAQVSALDKDSVTVQHMAAFEGMPQMATWLLYQGAYKNRFQLHEESKLAVAAAAAAQLGAEALAEQQAPAPSSWLHTPGASVSAAAAAAAAADVAPPTELLERRGAMSVPTAWRGPPAAAARRSGADVLPDAQDTGRAALAPAPPPRPRGGAARR